MRKWLGGEQHKNLTVLAFAIVLTVSILMAMIVGFEKTFPIAISALLICMLSAVWGLVGSILWP